jgi:hypothetical protein
MAQDNDSHEEKTPSNTTKAPDDWVTNDEPSTDAQHSYLRTLATEACDKTDETLTKGEATWCRV